MAIQWTTTEQSAHSNGVKCLVYADAGMGKTVLCASAPNPIIVSNESGLLSLSPQNIARVYGENAPGVSYNLNVAQVTTVNDLTEILDWLEKSNEAKQFQTVCLDSISEIAEVVLNNAKRQVKDPRQAYGELIEKMESVIRGYRDLVGKHVYMTAKMEPTKDEMTGVVKYGPSMPGNKLQSKLPYFFDEVFRLGVNKDAQGNSFRFLQTQPDLQFVAKDRSGALAAMEYPHLASVFNKISGV